jgi:hypothetical protein
MHSNSGGRANVCKNTLRRRFYLCGRAHSCTGYWYNTYNIAAVAETLENKQPPGQLQCITRWEPEQWNALIVNFVVYNCNMHWGLLLAMRYEQTVDIIYADSIRWSEREWVERFKRWWTQVDRQEQTVINLVEHDIQLPQQTETVECGVFTTCYHQAVFELSQEESWRCQDRHTRVTQVKEALSKITPAVAAHKRRATRETLYLHGCRISLRVEEQMKQMLTDLAKEKEATGQ